MTRILGVALALLVAVAAGSFANAAGESDATGQAGISLALPGDPGNFDPATNWLHILAAQQFLTLVDWDYGSSEPIPNAAESWTVSEDGRTYTFTLRSGPDLVRRQSVTAADFEYSFRTIVDPESAAPISYRAFVIENAAAVNAGEQPVSALGVHAVDDVTLTITLTEPATWFLSSLSSMGHSVPSAAARRTAPTGVKPENIVVNGPYKLVEAVAEDRYVLERNDSYFDAGNVGIPRITFLRGQDASTQLAMYEAGRAGLYRVDSRRASWTASATTTCSVPSTTTAAVRGVLLLLQHGQAAVQPGTGAQGIRRGTGQGHGHQPHHARRRGTGDHHDTPDLPGHVPNETGMGIPYDPEQAKAWLAQAGYPNGDGLPEIELGYNASQLHQNIAQAIQKMWQDTLGATVSLRGVEGRAYSVNAAQDAHDGWRMGWGMDYPDAHNIHMELFHSSVGQPATFKNPEYDRIIEEAAVASDLATRQQLYRIAERILVQDQVGVIPIYWYADNSLTKPHVDRPQTPQFMKLFKDWEVN